jgi:hypothetical protein
MLSMWMMCGLVVLNFWTTATITAALVSGLNGRGSDRVPRKRDAEGQEGMTHALGSSIAPARRVDDVALAGIMSAYMYAGDTRQITLLRRRD